MGSIAHTVPYARPCHRSLYSDFSLGFHPQKLAAEHGWLFGKENSACSVLLAPSSANPKATQSLQQGAGERWWGEFLLTHVRVRVSSPWPVDMKDVMGFPIRRQERRGASSSPVVRGKILGLLFQVDHCICCCEHCYIIRLKKKKMQRPLLVKKTLSRTVPIFYREIWHCLCLRPFLCFHQSAFFLHESLPCSSRSTSFHGCQCICQCLDGFRFLEFHCFLCPCI